MLPSKNTLGPPKGKHHEEVVLLGSSLSGNLCFAVRVHRQNRCWPDAAYEGKTPCVKPAGVLRELRIVGSYLLGSSLCT